jgi:hypothetical protein
LAESLSGEILGKPAPIGSLADFPVQFDQKLQPADDAIGPDKSLFTGKEVKKLDGKRNWLPKTQKLHRNPGKQGTVEVSDEDRLSEHDKSNGLQQSTLPDGSQQSQPRVTKDQSRPLLSPQKSSLRRIRLLDPDNLKDVEYRKDTPTSISQDLELEFLSGVSGNLVQVQSTYASSSVLNINIHSTPRLQDNSKLLGRKFSRSWAGS